METIYEVGKGGRLVHPKKRKIKRGRLLVL